MKNTVLRITAAICFATTLVSGIKSFFMGEYGNVPFYITTVALLPAVASLLMVLGVLFAKPLVTAIGALLYMIQRIMYTISYISILQMDLPEPGRTNVKANIIAGILSVLAFMCLAAGCFFVKHGKKMCIVAAVLFLIRSVVLPLMMSGSNPLSSVMYILTALGLTVGSVILGLSLEKRKVWNE